MKTLELNIPDLRIAYKTWGNPDNPTILALHGWLDNANSFDGIAPFLAEHYHFIAIDLPGHGLSGHLPLSAHYHFIDAPFTLIHILNALNLDKVHLLGHSMGACLSSIAAGIAPNRFLSVGLIEGLGPFSHPEDTACTQLAHYLEYLTQKNSKSLKGYASIEYAALARAMKGYVSLEIAKTLCERGIVEKKGQFYWRHDRRLLVPSPLRMTEQQILSCLRQISVKTYLIWASKGFSFDSQLMQQRIKAIEHLTIQHVEGGHHVHMEQPEMVSQLLLNFYYSFK